MRDYQNSIHQAGLNKKKWAGSNTVVNTENNVTKVYFYGNLIGVVDHNGKSAIFDNCGFNNACTTARINAVKMAVKDLGYTILKG